MFLWGQTPTFYKKLAEKLTLDESIDISVHDVADRVRHHREIYHSYKGNAANFHHAHVKNLAYSDLLKKCFAVKKKTIRAPRNLRSRRFSICTSTSSTARIVATTPTMITMDSELTRVLRYLHTHHELDANKLTLFAKYCEKNLVAANVFLSIEGHDHMMTFINQLDLSNYSVSSFAL
ncbi:hypothetical protein Hdeb2414_s0257g00849811 [Helianthus debilis subsp. tardiflorus]